MESELPLCANGNLERMHFRMHRWLHLTAVDAIFRLIRVSTAISHYIGYSDALFGNATAGLKNLNFSAREKWTRTS
jgi:hypothetical protein